jgi:hypothetical protein
MALAIFCPKRREHHSPIQKDPKEKETSVMGQQIQAAAATAYQRALEYKLCASKGPASACRKIDPVTGEVVAVIPARIPQA